MATEWLIAVGNTPQHPHMEDSPIPKVPNESPIPSIQKLLNENESSKAQWFRELNLAI